MRRCSHTLRALALLLLLALTACAPGAPAPEPTVTVFLPSATRAQAPVTSPTPAPDDMGPLRIRSVRVRCGWDDLACAVQELTIDELGQARYSLTTRGPEAPPGRYSEALSLSQAELAHIASVVEQERFLELGTKKAGPCYDGSLLEVKRGAKSKLVCPAYGDDLIILEPGAPRILDAIWTDTPSISALEVRPEVLAVSTQVAAAGPSQIKWFVGLGTGTDTKQAETEQRVVDALNEASGDDFYLWLNVIPSSEAYDVLETQIEDGTPPDIIGPVGLRGIDTFKEALLPLDDLIARHNVDLSGYDEGALAAYRDEQGRLLALPYALFPSFIYVNKDLFDASGLPYPPQKFGEQYEGKPWDMAALRALGMRLTLDASGRNATEPEFDPTQIVQVGFVPQWNDSAINEGAFFGAGDLTGPNDEATIPEAWKEAWRWFHQARHVDHFVPDAAYANSDTFGQGNVWQAGKAALAWTHLWYTCCFAPADVPRWDLAVVPSYDGTTTAKLHADTFAIIDRPGRTVEETDAAFKTYLSLLQSQELRALYGGLSPVKAEQPAYFAALDAKFKPNQVNWQVALDSLAYPDMPSHEQSTPNYLKFEKRYAAFDTLRHQDPALDLDAEIARLERDLTAIFQE